MTDLLSHRRLFAEEIQARANLRTPALVDAFATVAREDFLPPGPWIIRGEGDPGAGARITPDADPRHVYRNVSVAIDVSRQLFNGGPTAVAPAIDALRLDAGNRILHLGCGLGYYTAVMAHVVGPAGHVLAIEIDEALAAASRTNLAALGWVKVRHGNGAERFDDFFDAILIHAGVTHPLDVWLDALAVGGRLVVSITAAMPQMGPLSKGFMFLVTRRGDEMFDARPLNPLAIYTALGVRDESLNAAIGRALMKGLSPQVSRLRRDRHDPDGACWLHGSTFCLAA